MSRPAAGEVLQHLFRDHDAGRIGRAEFDARKAFILGRGGGRLTVPLPGPLTRGWRWLVARLAER
jgi:hypothetical protein